MGKGELELDVMVVSYLGVKESGQLPPPGHL